jgi:hypothetical protein
MYKSDLWEHQQHHLIKNPLKEYSYANILKFYTPLLSLLSSLWFGLLLPIFEFHIIFESSICPLYVSRLFTTALSGVNLFYSAFV